MTKYFVKPFKKVAYKKSFTYQLISKTNLIATEKRNNQYLINTIFNLPLFFCRLHKCNTLKWPSEHSNRIMVKYH